MKLLFVIDSLGSGGAQRQMVTLALGLKKRGHSVDFYLYYPQDHYRWLLDEAGITVHLHLKRSRFSFGPLWALRCLIHKGAYDIVLSFLDTPNFYAAFGCLGTSVKLVTSERFMYPPEPLSAFQRIFQQYHRVSDRITVNSHHQRTRMINEFPWMSEKIITVYNGVDLGRFSGDGSYKVHQSELSLVGIGTITPKKNMLALAQALLICRNKYNINPTVHWVGKRDQTSSGRKAFEDTASFLRENNLVQQWQWLGERSDVPELLKRYDALIHPSLFEGLPNVICEALASSLPVLAGRVCDHPWLVEEGIRGYLFDPKDPADIAAAIHHFHSSPVSARHEMGKASRLFAETNLSADGFTDSYEALFLTLLGR